MKASRGDWLIVNGARAGLPERHGLIVKVHGTDGSPPYQVRWEDSDIETLVFPGPDAHVVTEVEALERRRGRPD